MNKKYCKEPLWIKGTCSKHLIIEKKVSFLKCFQFNSFFKTKKKKGSKMFSISQFILDIISNKEKNGSLWYDA